jgi:hypothetical protein
MGNNHDVSGTLTLLFPLAMILTNLLGAEINKAFDIKNAGNARRQ